MLEKLAKQTAIYGISTIVVRFLNYLLTPYFTRVFDPGIYGITVDVYALIPFALVILTMGMESGYFRFAAKADEAGGDVTAAKRRLFATTWGITSLAALLFFGLVTLFRTTVSEWMGADYAANPDFAAQLEARKAELKQAFIVSEVVIAASKEAEQNRLFTPRLSQAAFTSSVFFICRSHHHK